jgi:hypothetical protein
VERYRLIDYDAAKDGLARDEKENFRVNGIADRNYRGKYVQVEFTVGDDGVFTTPWTATITYGRGSNDWPETVCAENTLRTGANGDKDTAVPTSDKPDF